MEQIPPHNGTITSISAAVSMRAIAPTQRARILAYVDSHGSEGSTRDEIEDALGLKGDSVRPRVRVLLDEGKLIELEKVYRQTRNGFWALVLVSKRHAEGLV